MSVCRLPVSFVSSFVLLVIAVSLSFSSFLFVFLLLLLSSLSLLFVVLWVMFVDPVLIKDRASICSSSTLSFVSSNLPLIVCRYSC